METQHVAVLRVVDVVPEMGKEFMVIYVGQILDRGDLQVGEF